MDSSGFSSPRSGIFPAGLRVLVVDDDSTWLKILEKMLKKCNYQVTVCNLAREALHLLRERKDGYDIVISDVNMPDIDGFKLLEHVGLEMDLPVIMMSVDGETHRVMKGVQHGACDYLLKPIRMKELRNIWQHVFRKRMHEVRDIEGQESLEELQMMRNGTEKFDDGFLFSGDFSPGKKRKDTDNKYDDRLCGDPSSMKKSRVVWTVDLHQKFVKAVNHIGLDKVGPKKILDLMGVTWLSRENVASHLQKYRLYLSRLQKENELKAALGGINHADICSKDSSANVCLQSSISQNAITFPLNTATNKGHAAVPHQIPIHRDNPKLRERNTLSMPITESKKPLFENVVDPPGSSCSHSFGPVNSKVKSEPKILAENSWSPRGPYIQFYQEKRPHLPLQHVLNSLTQPMHHIQVDSVQPSISCNFRASKEVLKPTVADIESSNGSSRGQSIGKSSKVKSTTAMFPTQPQCDLTAFEQVPSSIWSTKNHDLEPLPFDDLGASRRNFIIGGNRTTFGMWDEDFNCFSSPVNFHLPNAEIGSMASFGCSNQEVISDIPPHLYDSLGFGNDYASEPLEYPVMDQGLYIA